MEKVYLYVTTPLGKEKFLLEKITGEEHISALFHYRLRLKSEDDAVDFSGIVGKNATVTIEQYSGDKRYINGIVSRFIQAGFDGKMTTYYADIRPWLWQLTLTANCKIFQNQTAPDIISAVFSELGFTDFEDRTIKPCKQREYCVQYQETAFAFVSRLMEDEGVFYFFEHSDGKHMLVMADDADAYQPCPGTDYARMRYVSPGDRLDDNYITRCALEQQMVPTRYATEDYNFTTPATDLLSSAEGKESGNFRVYEYPGNFEITAEGETLSDKRIEALELPRKMLRGEGVCRSFVAGYTFDFMEHEREDMNVTYVLKNLFIRADQDGYTNTFEAFPADVPFRPPRTTQKPKIPGTQTALVVGKSGEEIWTDKYGRIKVQFYWDQEGKKNENSSCWVRVTQMWAGKNWGTMFIPRMGAEVIVSFLEGDPDRPIVTGTVYNASQTVPYPLPGEKTKSAMKTNSSLGGGGFNEIRFEDKKGAEEIFIHGQKDWTIVIENDKNQTIGHDESLSVGNNRTKSVGVDQSETIGSNKSIKVGSNHTESIGSNKSLNVGANHTETIGADMSLTVTKNKTENVGVNSSETVGAVKSVTVGAAYQVSVGAAMNETIAAVRAEEVGASKSVNVGASSSENVGADKSVSAGKNITESAGKDVSVQSGKKMSLRAGDDFSISGDKKGVIDIKDQLTIKCGKASITLKKNGDISIKGKKINMKGSGNIILKGKKILEN